MTIRKSFKDKDLRSSNAMTTRRAQVFRAGEPEAGEYPAGAIIFSAQLSALDGPQAGYLRHGDQSSYGKLSRGVMGMVKVF
jgi:hypothetical protein